MNTSDLIGMKVMNKQTKSIGRIESICNRILVVIVHGEICKYSFPSCFSNILEVEDEELQRELENESMHSIFMDFKKKYKSAIWHDIEILKITGGKKYRAIDGVLLSLPNEKYVYAFDTDADLHFTYGTEIKICSFDSIISAYVVDCEEFTLIIRTKENLGKHINMIEFTVEQRDRKSVV